MRRASHSFVLLAALVASGCAADDDGGEGSEIAVATPDAPTPGKVTVQVTDVVGGTSGGIAGLPVIFNDVNGNTVGNGGVTDANGRFAQNNVPAGASASVLVGRGTNAPELQTVYSVQPGTTVFFTNLAGAPGPRTTASVTLTNLPFPNDSDSTIIVSIGDCSAQTFGPSPGPVQIEVAATCMQTDGFFTVYATIQRPFNGVFADAFVKDVAPAMFGTVTNVTVADWRVSPEGGANLSVYGFAAPLVETEFQKPAPSIAVERKGVAYRGIAVVPGTVGDTDILGEQLQFPTDLGTVGNGAGYRFGIGAQLHTPAGPVSVLYQDRRQVLENPFEFDAGPISKDLVDWNGTFDLSTPTRPRVTWTNHTGSTLNAVVVLMQWQDPTLPGSAFTWIATAPYTLKGVRMPRLPSSYGRFSFPSLGQVTAPVILAVEDSRHPTYDDFITHESVYAGAIVMPLKGSRLRLAARELAIDPRTVAPAANPLLRELLR